MYVFKICNVLFYYSVLERFLVKSHGQLQMMRLAEELSVGSRLRRSLVEIGVWRSLSLISRTRYQLAISPRGEVYASSDTTDVSCEYEEIMCRILSPITVSTEGDKEGNTETSAHRIGITITSNTLLSEPKMDS